ncbi:hypothetical protein BDZ94DRAFT_1259214 [Collybia nuda]|uniref:Uncharacterized protein n=1 Tax=Collybia nuda TaxID=64659 RepID=A0A9P5Y715_9AGAR|nr:hypothetical protein BDZ94DRAFT_1259214 [Collybia nuda]
MPSFSFLSTLPAAIALIATAVMASPLHAMSSSIASRATGNTRIGRVEVTEYMWNYAGFTIEIGERVVTEAFKAVHVSPIQLSGVVGTDGISMTGTGFILEYPKPFLIDRGNNLFTSGIGYKTLLYDYQSLRPTNGSILLPITSAHAEEFLKDLKIDEEIRKLPGISASEKEHIIDTRHYYTQYGYSNVLPNDISEAHQNQVQAVYQRAADISLAREIVITLNKMLDRMIAIAKKYGRSEYGIIEELQSRGNVVASFIGHAVKPPSKDGIVRSPVHGGGLNGEITMWSKGLSLYMNLRLDSDVPGDARAVNTGDVKLFTLNCSGSNKPMYCNPYSRGNGIIHLGRFFRFVTAFF